MNPINFVTFCHEITRGHFTKPSLRDAYYVRNDVEFAISLLRLFCVFMIINVQITVKFSL